jgi:hypothetical protein
VAAVCYYGQTFLCGHPEPVEGSNAAGTRSGRFDAGRHALFFFELALFISPGAAALFSWLLYS